jgi:hypothetical protein
MATQMFTATSPLVRKDMTDLYIHRLRNQADLEAIIEEVSAVYDKKMLYQVYRLATQEPDSFVYIELTAKTAGDMFSCD